MKTKRAVFLWGPPGISKSATAQQIAVENKIGFVDLRLSQMEPTDLRGIPFPVIENGVHGVRWSAPLALPRNLSYDQKLEVEGEITRIRFDNPLGAEPEINVRFLRGRGDTSDYKAVIFERGKDWFTTALVNSDYKVPTKRVPVYDEEDPERVIDHLVVTDMDAVNATPPEFHWGRLGWTVTGEVSAILALEEFNSAPPSVQAASYQLVLDRKLGEYEVPDNVFIMAMGNRETDRGVTFRMPTPVANRFIHFEMVPDYDDWETWAIKSRAIIPRVMQYLQRYKGKLFDFQPNNAARGFKTPRSWHMFSDVLAANPKLPHVVKKAVAAGCVGDGEASEFLQFEDFLDKLPSNEEVLSGRTKTMRDKSPQVCFALSTGLCFELRDRADKVKANGNKKEDRLEWFKQADNFIAFVLLNFPKDAGVVAAKHSISLYKLPFDTVAMENFDRFAMENRDVIMGTDEDDDDDD
jgi:MoxR-like ATPase